MIAALIAAFVTQAGVEAPPEEIVVTATRRGRCEVRLDDRTLTSRQLRASAQRWALQGTPLRVVRPRGAHYRCLAKIAFRLNEHGVTLIQFVDR